MRCKECKYNNSGFCKHPDQKAPFLMVRDNDSCWLERTKLQCKNCKYWIEAEGTERTDDIGGCTYGGGYFPTFLEEHCILKDEYLRNAEKENGYLTDFLQQKTR